MVDWETARWSQAPAAAGNNRNLQTAYWGVAGGTVCTAIVHQLLDLKVLPSNATHLLPPSTSHPYAATTASGWHHHTGPCVIRDGCGVDLGLKQAVAAMAVAAVAAAADCSIRVLVTKVCRMVVGVVVVRVANYSLCISCEQECSLSMHTVHSFCMHNLSEAVQLVSYA